MFMQRRHVLFVSLQLLCPFTQSITNVMTWNMLKTTEITNQQLSSFFWQAVACYFTFSLKCACFELAGRKKILLLWVSQEAEVCVQLSWGYCYLSWSFTNVSEKPPSLQHSSKHAHRNFDLDCNFKVNLKANLILAEKCNHRFSTAHEEQILFSCRGCICTHGKEFRTFTGNKNIT